MLASQVRHVVWVLTEAGYPLSGVRNRGAHPDADASAGSGGGQDPGERDIGVGEPVEIGG
jgi:hypothetical protein